jgi:hypothetical protein
MAAQPLQLPPFTPMNGPFKVSISNAEGIIYEMNFPDASGNLPPSAAVVGTIGVGDLMVNLLTGALRVICGRSG